MKYDVVGVGDVAYDNLCIVERYPEEDGSSHILECIIREAAAVLPLW